MKKKVVLLLGVVVIVALVSQVFLTKKIWVGKPRNASAKLLGGSDDGKVSNGNNISKGTGGKPSPHIEEVKANVDAPKNADSHDVENEAERKKEAIEIQLDDKSKNGESKRGSSLPMIVCEPGAPCEYNAEVDLRVIVMVFDRSESLAKVLESLQSLEVDGDSGVVEIWIDRSSKTNEPDAETVQVAKQFKWKHGPSRVNIQRAHVGIYGQWIDTWRPKEHSKEIALFLEDDVDVSPYAYRWLKAAFNTYRSARRIASYALFEGAILRMNDKLMPTDQPAFLHQRMGSQGMSPDPNHWRDFQDWFHRVRKDQAFHPYVSNDPEVTSWYKTFEKSNKASSMWSIWYIYYNDKHNLWTLYTNLGKVMHNRDAALREDQYLAFHRKEKGLHFKGRPMSSKNKLVTEWHDYLVTFPPYESLQKFSYHGKKIK